MKKYWNYFKIPFLLLALTGGIGITCYFITSRSVKTGFTRSNMQCTSERVFDMAEVLSEEEEAVLREKIAKAEAVCGTDIILVTLNESLEAYVNAYAGLLAGERLEPSQYTCVYADNFYDENEFGFDRPHGDGVILVDNWYRESDGGVYSWMGTSGRAMEQFSEAKINHVLDKALAVVDEDPAAAYGCFVDLVREELAQESSLGDALGGGISVVLGVIAGLVFFFVHFWGSQKGKKTVGNETYVKNKNSWVKERQDIFLNRTVTRRRIAASGTGGSGGGHVSAGGHSHGGGGHRR